MEIAITEKCKDCGGKGVLVHMEVGDNVTGYARVCPVCVGAGEIERYVAVSEKVLVNAASGEEFVVLCLVKEDE